MAELRKYRYEFPPLEPHWVEAPSPRAMIEFLKRTYPHNWDEVLPSLVEIPDWPRFWKTIDEDGRVLPPNKIRQPPTAE